MSGAIAESDRAAILLRHTDIVNTVFADAQGSFVPMTDLTAQVVTLPKLGS